VGYTVDFKKEAFNKVYLPLLENETRVQIIFGGASAGKSHFAAQRCIRDLLKGGRNYLNVRKVGKYIRGSTFNEQTKAIRRYGLDDLFKIHSTNMSITCVNGYQSISAGLEDVDRIKSITPEKGIVTDILVEEATETSRNDITQLKKRLRGLTGGLKKRITLLFNPIFQSHWIFKDYFKGWVDGSTEYRDDSLLILKTTYKDNRFLEPDDIKELEDEKDDYFYQVYTLGNWGILGGLIFNNWKTADILNDPILKTFDHFYNGLDFGYTAHPTAFNRMYYHRGLQRLYIVYEYHEKNVTNDVIASDLKRLINSGDLITCDSAEPKSIRELCDHGLNAVGAKKGKGSINHGIQWLKQQEIIIDKTCQETINEFQLYHFLKDKYGETTNVPADRDNHHIDDIRYGTEPLSEFSDNVDIGSGDDMESVESDW